MNRTKAAIVDAFNQLLEERPYGRITVKDIVERCGVNRNTFYYYFADIPSLVEETSQEMINEIIRSCAKLDSPMDCLGPLSRYMTEHRRAILHIYRSAQREFFQQSLDRLAAYAAGRYVETVAKEVFPSGAESAEKPMLIRCYKCALVGGVLDWLDHGMSYDLVSDAETLCRLFDGAGRQALLRCAPPTPAE